METFDLKSVCRAPDQVFDHPRRVVLATYLSHDDKVFVLRRWKQALEKRCVSSGAAASRSAPIEPEVTAKLADISCALDELRLQ